jgi:hypothetical protein
MDKLWKRCQHCRMVFHPRPGESAACWHDRKHCSTACIIAEGLARNGKARPAWLQGYWEQHIMPLKRA